MLLDFLVTKKQELLLVLLLMHKRLFYSGITSSVNGADSKSPNYSGYVFFTKVITADNDFGKCHQEADPTDPKY